MVDIHIHILPGIDDGSRDIYETLKMAQLAADNGITDIIATPHCNIPGRYSNYFDEDYRKLFQWVWDVIRREKIPVRLYPGMEVFTTPEVPKLLTDGKLMTLNGSRYLLMEFDFGEEAGFALDMLEQVAKFGVIPVIAHAERFEFLQEEPELVPLLRSRGYVIQSNKGSFLGRFGRREKHLAWSMMRQGLVDVIATDAHRPYTRTPEIEDVYELLSEEFDEAQLSRVFEKNPRRILMDKPILRPRAEKQHPVL